MTEAYEVVDHNVRVATPAALDRAGLHSEAMRLRNMPPLRTMGDLLRAAQLIDRAQQALKERAK